MLLSFGIGTVCRANGSAEEYKGCTLFNLKGKVAKVKSDSKYKWAKKNVEFSDNGLIRESTMAYDSEGLPRGYSMVGMGMKNVVDIVYDRDGRLVEVIYLSTIPGMKDDITFTFTYDGDRVSGLRQTDKDGVTTLEYTGEIYDNIGNWVERTVVETSPGKNGKQSKSKEYVEKRTITYFD